MFSNPAIKSIEIIASGRAGVEFAIVTFVDGSFGITRDGKPILGYRWYKLDGEMDECVAVFLRLTGETPVPPTPDQAVPENPPDSPR